jgi:hypothetical protein
MDVPADRPIERPRITVLMLRADDTRETPEAVFNHPHAWVVVDLLKVYDYMALGFKPLAVDPTSEAAWHAWRKKNPEAA